MFIHFQKRAAFLSCLLTCCIAAAAQTGAPNQKEKDDLTSFLNSVAAGVYKLAWPTATYKTTEFAGFRREADGIAVVMKLSGEGLFGDDLWLKLGVIVNRDGIQDVRVIDHDALFAPPFATSKAIGNLVTELAKAYSDRQAQNQSVSRTMAGVVCIMNPTDRDLGFVYRWGDAAWQRDEIESGKNGLYWWKYETEEHTSPKFYIRYIDDLAARNTEHSYWLERTATALPASCGDVSKYRFSLDGVRVLLNQVK